MQQLIIPLLFMRGIAKTFHNRKRYGDRNGEAWWHWKKLQQDAANRLCYAESQGIPVQDRIYGTEQDALRPSFIQPINCRTVLIEGNSIKNVLQWTIHPVYCENVIIRNVNVISCGSNTDGLNPDSCKNVLVEVSYFETGDDCIAINSGMNEDGWRVNKPCENNRTWQLGHWKRHVWRSQKRIRS